MQTTHEVDEGILGDELADVEDGRSPRILLAREAQIRDEAEDLVVSAMVCSRDGWVDLRWHSSGSACQGTEGRRRNTSTPTGQPCSSNVRVWSPTMGRMVRSIFLSSSLSSSGVGSGNDSVVSPCFSSKSCSPPRTGPGSGPSTVLSTARDMLTD